jgi:transposase
MEATKNKSQRQKRRQYTAEFKAGAVQLVLEGGKSVTDAARDLDLTRSALDKWVSQAKTDAGKGRAGSLTTAEKEELGRLRRENRELRMERDILKKATAFFARESMRGSR